MSEPICKELVQIFNEIADFQTATYKIDAAIFTRNSNKIIEEKVSFLEDILKSEARTCYQNEDNYYDTISLIISHYRQKLNMIYDEFYCQYINIQNELQETKLNKQILITNYQKIVNEIEQNPESGNEYLSKKEELREKNKVYNKIIDMCYAKFDECKMKFDKKIDNEFLITKTALQISEPKNIFEKIINTLKGIFSGKKKYQDFLTKYRKTVDEIDSHELISEMRDETIDFVTDILELRGYSETDLAESLG